MKPILVDSNVLIDVITGDPNFGVWSTAQIALWADRSQLVINPLI